MLLLYWSVKILISLFINLKLIIPISWSEKNIIIIPAIILKIFELVKKNFPINEAVDPKVIKIKEKPKKVKSILDIEDVAFAGNEGERELIANLNGDLTSFSIDNTRLDKHKGGMIWIYNNKWTYFKKVD